ncbi:MAG: hypothetical protein KGL39_01365 [Patescibacteria group bacterium]|nr:hypothetical protein [Patescibacteria group bacterium]
MTPKHKLQFSIAANAAILVTVLALTGYFAADSTYWRVGWHEELVVIAVVINSGFRYAALVALIALANVSGALAEQFGEPVVDFSLYNPDKRVISEFSRAELFAAAVALRSLASVREVLLLMVSFAQVDIALWNLAITTAVAVCVVCALLREKRFAAAGASFAQLQEDFGMDVV